MKRLVAAFWLLAALPAASEPLMTKVGMLREQHSQETLSILDLPAPDDALAGALLGAADNNTTGKFTNQRFETVDESVDDSADVGAAVDALLDKGVSLIIADLSADRLLAASDRAKARGALLFNISAPDERLREADCRANVIHVAPTRSMLADGLAQYLIWKQWRRWLLIKGSHPKDELLAQAFRNSAKKFGAKIVEERIYEDTGGGRRSDSGSVQTQRQIPVLTQNAPAYDVLVAADETEVFGGYLPYRTWDARPVAGSGGLMPASWDASHEQWGARQLQNRFTQTFRRLMNARDNAAWVAMRMVGEATTRTGSNDPEKLRLYLLGNDFSIAAFKGVRLTLRTWNQQLRQPILLSDRRMIVSVSPQEGFLHQTSELDTLGVDQPESKCKLK
ncbi:ABC transporter substrate-binding protein [Methylocystis sp. L43]|jgi:ABC transporter substrate binding protein (PQQ-dependent alcohol dehydrogenase system)|uniref:ABC transporter substrate-binding protein n=1 Tax=unclassified Methylocystis TaxID=2625913 RepID=UPI0018C21F0F|nr:MULTISPECIES: ABC transporter substrate-binding protein [unclassified Methylocystis]MBG0798474.1 ABC transporter substrate-binding protein [Methylocystis sp. L43]MBG0805948.1 ABC transporter substrate-binding protein [Methylocystis sp. H15]